jgi:ABC-2 type transport system ATP-binding protein
MTGSITATGVTRRFGALTAVDAVDLSIPPGTLYGFLGRNGAGKTTLIRMLLGLIRPNAGQVSILGRAVNSRGGPSGPWAEVGYLVDGPGLYPELSPRDHLHMAATYRRVPRPVCDEIVELLALGRYLDVRARTLSQGNRQRLGLAMALLHHPQVLILDEPTLGMDPAGMVEIRALLRGLADSGATVFMSSHMVPEVERVADEVGIIHEGRMLDQLSRARLNALGQPRLAITLAAPDLAIRAVAELEGHGIVATASGATLTMTDAASVERPEQVARLLVAADCPPRAMAVASDSLETHFLRVTGGTR